MQGDITPSLAEPVGATITDREIDNHEHGRGDEEHHRPFHGRSSTATFTVPSHGYSTGNDVQSTEMIRLGSMGRGISRCSVRTPFYPRSLTRAPR